MSTMFDMQKTVPELKKRLEKLKQEQKPGEGRGRGTKMEILTALLQELKELVDDGYTVFQIAEAMKIGDDFSILPKSITQALNKATNKTSRRSSRKNKNDVHKVAQNEKLTPTVKKTASLLDSDGVDYDMLF